MALWPDSSASTPSQLVAFYGVEAEVWSAFLQSAGDPGNDLRPLASLPVSTFTDCVTEAVKSDGRRLSVMEASQLGLVYRAAKRWLHVQAGLPTSSWVDRNPWEETQSVEATKEPMAATSGGERKLKYSQLIDQQDEGEFICHGEDMKAVWYGKFVEKMGGLSADQEDPTIEQLSALWRRTRSLRLPPYVDFAIWTPYGRRVNKNAKYQSFIMQEDGSFLSKMVPGPSSYSQWLASFRVMRSAFIMLDILSLNALLLWENHMERLVGRYSNCWHLVVEAENKARSEHLGRTRATIKMKMDRGERPPHGWKEEEPWEIVWRMVLEDNSFWQEQVHIPALAWLARGSRGQLLTPAEEVATTGLRSGAGALHHEESFQDVKKGSPNREKNKQKKEARKKRAKQEREELHALREQKSSKGGGHGKGGGKSSGGDQEECYAWNNGNGECSGLPAGERCRGKKPRLHRCTICKSPGHPSKDCPRKKSS